MNIIAAAALCGSLVSCVKNDTPEEPYMTAEVKEVTAAAKGETIYVDVSSNCDFSVDTQAEWCEYETHPQAPFSNLTLIVAKNDTPEPRSTDVVLSYPGVDDIVIKVSQEAGTLPGLDGINNKEPYRIEAEDCNEDYSPQQLDWWVQNPGFGFGPDFYISLRNGDSASYTVNVVDAGDYDFEFVVMCWGDGLNLSLSVDGELEGSVVPPAAASGDDPAYHVYIRNIPLTAGEHTFTIGTAGEVDFNYFVVTASSDEKSLEVSCDNIAFNSYAGELQLTVTSNGTVSAVSSEDWCRVTLLEGETDNLDIEVDPYSGESERSAAVTLSSEGAADVIVGVVQYSGTENRLHADMPLSIEAENNLENVAGKLNDWWVGNPHYGFGDNLHVELENAALSYPLNVADAGSYDFEFVVYTWGWQVSSTITLSVDGTAAGSVDTRKGDGGSTPAERISIEDIPLDAGEHVIGISFTNNTAFDRFIITSASF